MEQLNFEPMTIGGILDRTFRLYRQNFLRFLSIVSVIQIPMIIVGLVIGSIIFTSITSAALEGEKPNIMSTFVSLAALGFLAMLGQLLCTAALTRGISQTYLGKKPSVGQTYGAVASQLLTLVLASFLVALAFGLGLILLIVPGIIFLFWFSLTTQTIVIERVGVLEGMSRSKKLMSGNIGKLFVLGIVLFLISWVAGWVFSFAAKMFITQPTLSANTQEAIRVFISEMKTYALLISFFESVGKLIFMPISAGAMVLFYYDIRIRKEGFDLEMLAQSMGEEVPATPEVFGAGEDASSYGQDQL